MPSLTIGYKNAYIHIYDDLDGREVIRYQIGHEILGHANTVLGAKRAITKALGYEYDIQGCYSGGWETVCCEPTPQEARARLREYRENETGTAFRSVKRPVLATPSNL